MKRREFITLVGGAAVAWPLTARAQQAAMPVVAFVRSAPLSSVPHFIAAFRQGLKDQGFVEGHSVAIELRSAEDQPDRLPALVADLLARDITLIACDNFAARAAKAGTTTVPIVFAGGGDPVQSRRQSQSPRRQYYGDCLPYWLVGSQATRAAPPACA